MSQRDRAERLTLLAELRESAEAGNEDAAEQILVLEAELRQAGVKL